MRLLVIEDNRRMATLVAEGLERRGFRAEIVHDLAAADDAVALVQYDAIILDLGLPDGDGLAWLVRRRAARQMPPTVILTARSALDDRVLGLDSGADDYVVKPVAIDELAARIRALLRRPGTRAQPVISACGIAFDCANRTVTVADDLLELSRRETDLLELLLRRADSVVHRTAIENVLYSLSDAVTPNAVEAIVSRLRRKLEDAGVHDVLHTIRGVGYMLRDKSS